MNNIPDELKNRIFSVKEALKLGLNRPALSRMLKSGALDRISTGIYQSSDAEALSNEEQYRVAMLRCGQPSSICLLSALEHYHLTDIIPKQTWVLVPDYKRVRSKQLKLIRARNPHWKMGIIQEEGYKITSLERTLVECLVYRKTIGTQIALESVKQAIQQKKVKLHNLYEVAKKMGVERRIQNYLEALAV